MRNQLDFFQITFTIGLIIITIELVVGTVPHNPLVRPCAMPVPSLIFLFGVQLTFSAALQAAGARAPFRISSIPQGAPMLPGSYTIIEDVMAVDGNGGTAYREALNARYKASSLFRRMLTRLTIFWGVSALVVAGAITAVVFTAPVTVAYGVGESSTLAPFDS